MIVSELIKELEQLPQDKSVLCQVVGVDGPEAWNMSFKVSDIETSWMVQFKVFHPNLKHLPEEGWSEE